MKHITILLFFVCFSMPNDGFAKNTLINLAQLEWQNRILILHLKDNEKVENFNIFPTESIFFLFWTTNFNNSVLKLVLYGARLRIIQSYPGNIGS